MTSTPDKTKRQAWGLFWAAFAARLGAALYLGTLGRLAGDYRYDDGVFVEFAQSLLGQNSQLFLSHPPGYSLFLAPFLLLGEKTGLVAAGWAQLVLGAAAAPMTLFLARRAGAGERASLIAGALTAASPLMIYFCGRFMSETLFSVLLLAFFLAWTRAWEKGSSQYAALAGLFGGLASLTRGVMLPYGPALALAACVAPKKPRRWVLLVMVCGAAWAATVAPWTLRNWIRFERFVPVSLQGGWNLWEGLTDDPVEHARRPYDMGREAQALGLNSPFALDAHFGAKAKEWIASHPGEFFSLCVRKAFKFWRPFPHPPHGRAVIWSVGLFSLLLYAAALWGLSRGAWRAPGSWFLLAFVATLTLLHAVFASNLRYRLPLEPLLAVWAGWGLASLRKKG